MSGLDAPLWFFYSSLIDGSASDTVLSVGHRQTELDESAQSWIQLIKRAFVSLGCFVD